MWRLRNSSAFEAGSVRISEPQATSESFDFLARFGGFEVRIELSPAIVRTSNPAR
jgi:hypothetical protein